MRTLMSTVAAIVLLADGSAAQIPAFPGAEGPGADASGGRGGDVYHVTNLLDDHDGTIAGSLRYGLATAPTGGRTIVFDVGGTLNLVADVHNSTHTWLRSGADNITIAGQTAPGPGITIIGQGAKLSGDNWILRHVKFRPGQDQSRPGVLTNDGITNNLQNSIIDHVSVSWADDEGLSSTDFVENTTVQYSIIGEGLNYNDHSFGSLISSENDDAKIGYHHNLFVHNRSRNPRLGSEVGTGAITSFTNNVVYNWYGRSGYSFERPSRTNYLANYYIAGIDTRSTDVVFYSPDAQTILYHDDTNRVDMNKNGAVDGVVFGFSGPQFSGTYQEALAPFDVPSGHVQSAADAVNQVLDYVGAAWWDRDPVDARLTDDVRNGAGVTIDHIDDAPQDPNYSYDSEGYPIYGVTQQAPDFDQDGDGMPGWWELKHGLDPTVPNHNGDFDGDAYTDLEEYLNELGAFPAPTAIEWMGGDGDFAQSQNWGIRQSVPFDTYTHWQPSRYDVAVIPSGNAAVAAVGQHSGTIKVAPQPGQSAGLSVAEGWLEIAESLEIAAAGANGVVSLSGGELRVASITKGSGGSFTFTGGVLSADSVGFDLLNAGGTIAPGQSAGQTQVLGDLTIEAGVLEIELGGAAADGEFDRVTVGGNATLAGTLEVSLLEDYSLMPDSTYEILEVAGKRTGQFAGLNEGSLVGNFGLDLYITYLGGDGDDVALFTLPGLVGDFDRDGDVDGNDFLHWQRNPEVGELVDWEGNFGSSPPNENDAAILPEPSALVIALVAFCLAFRHYR